ncbi:endonuclease III [bacterium]|nr:endonuclease III [candidate division CSSED10-310 bacterium]
MAAGRETLVERNIRVQSIIRRLIVAFPDPVTALHHGTALELLIATILSAQCTDERVNQDTVTLFARYRGASDYAAAPRERLEADIRSTGFFRNKAKSIQECCSMLIERHGGEVPSTMEELVALPGVGRKTANVILGNHFGIPGVVVDTHVTRLSRRLGLTTNQVPDKIELDLQKMVPREWWSRFSNLLILHGRKTCKARVPTCATCVINDLCPSTTVVAD